MFGKKNIITTIKASAPLSPDFGSEFIHTMKDDLNPSSSQMNSSVPAQEKKISSENNSAQSSSSPFLNQPGSSAQSTAKPFISRAETVSSEKKQSTEQSGSFTVPVNEKIVVPQKSTLLKKIVLAIILVLVAVVFSVGGYYFWKTKNDSVLTETPMPTEMPSETSDQIAEEAKQNQVVITPISEKYSYEKPNYLPINIELTSSDDIQRIVSSTAQELSAIQTKTPFEFIVTDSNNVPLAFPIFSLAANLNLSPELLVNLEEQFSFYIYNDAGNARTGIAIELKNKDQAWEEMIKDEPNLVGSLSFLFLSEPTLLNESSFMASSYNETPVRYLNLNSDKSISIDYTTYDNKLLIATSRDALRAIIDKIAAQKNSPTIPTETIPLSTPNETPLVSE